MRSFMLRGAVHACKYISKPAIRNFESTLFNTRAFSTFTRQSSTFLTYPEEDETISKKKFTISQMKKKHKEHIPITMVTASDYHSASMLDKAGIDIVLVGDSLSITTLGHPDTTRVTVDEMIHHAKAVKRACRRALMIGDMPFGSYETNNETALTNAFRFIKEAGMHAVKVEGGASIADRVRTITNAGVSVFGHIGFPTQSAIAHGSYKQSLKSKDEALQLMQDAIALEEAGCIGIILECVPEKIAREISFRLNIPTIGIGSGIHVDGQLLVFADLLGMYDKFTPKFCRQYAQVNQVMQKAISRYRDDVITRQFPSPEYVTRVKKNELSAFMAELPPVDELKRLELESINNRKRDDEGIIEFPESMNILVVGAGALGSLIGGKIIAMGKHNLWLWDNWEDQVTTVQQKGISIMNHNDVNPQRVVEVNITSDINQIKPDSFHIAIVLTKGFSQEAADVVNTALCAHGIVLTLQNGLGNKEMIQKLLTRQYRILRGIVYIGATLMKPGIVKQNSKRDREIIVDNASYYGTVLTELLNGAGFQAFASDDIYSQIWEKLIVNCAINPLTALFSLKNGEIAENPKMRNLVIKVVEECVRVARTDGRIKLESYDPGQVTQRIVSVAQATANNTSSMLADMNRLREKREKGTTKREIKTEISRINGAIVAAANKYEIGVPYNTILVEMVEALEEHLNAPKN